MSIHTTIQQRPNLRGATLNETVWLGTLVDECQFGEGSGLTKIQRKDLELRGARFNFEEEDPHCTSSQQNQNYPV